MPDLHLVQQPPAPTSAYPSPLERGLPHDLPPRWDGTLVVWDAWKDEPVVFVCPPPRRSAGGCPARCGSQVLRQRATGSVARLPSITAEQIEGYTRGGRPGKVVLRRLYATRCECGHTQVYDMDADELWDLDDTDYDDVGSVPPAPETLF